MSNRSPTEGNWFSSRMSLGPLMLWRYSDQSVASFK
jgi:hypothetical protein